VHRDNAQFHDLGTDHFDSRVNINHTMRSHVRELQALGYKVALETAA
jgi:transposase